MIETKPEYYFKKIKDFAFPELFNVKNVWEILKKKDELLSNFKKSEIKGTIGKNVHTDGILLLEKGSKILENSIIEGPVYIGKNCVIGPNAHIRRYTIIGDNSKIGKTEVKGSVIMNNVRADHLGYIGESILGDSVHIGAGVVTANLRFDNKNVNETGLKKLGIIAGDNVQIGINVSTLPGTFIGPNTWIYPGSIVKGFLPANKLLKSKIEYEISDKT